MASLADLLRHVKETGETLSTGYPNAKRFADALLANVERNVPTTQELQNPAYMQQRSLNYMSPMAGAIKAYHGTPHEFDRFDMSKIGTGEGAQAYGHGLYFAENPEVAEQYQKRLGSIPSVTDFLKSHGIDDKSLSTFIADDIVSKNGDWSKVASNLKSMADVYDDKDNLLLKKVAGLLEQKTPEISSGAIYETSIQWPDAAREASDPLSEHHLLDWDKPFDQQSDYVRNKLKKSDFYKNAKNAYKNQKQWYLDPSTKTGENFLKYMRSGYGDEIGTGIQNAEQYLNNLGIPGIKYLDQGSRTGGGTSNYVMFGDEYSQIVNRAGSLAQLLRNK